MHEDNGRPEIGGAADGFHGNAGPVFGSGISDGDDQIRLSHKELGLRTIAH